MIMYKRILVPLDGSARAERAILVAARIARASGGSVILMRVATAPVDTGKFSSASGYVEEQLMLISQMLQATSNVLLDQLNWQVSKQRSRASSAQLRRQSSTENHHV